MNHFSAPTQTKIHQNSETETVADQHHKSWCGINSHLPEDLFKGSNFKSRLISESLESGRGLLPNMTCHVAPLSEPTMHDSINHTIALRNSSDYYHIVLVWHNNHLQGRNVRTSGKGLPTRDRNPCRTLPCEPMHDPNKHTTAHKSNDSIVFS